MEHGCLLRLEISKEDVIFLFVCLFLPGLQGNVFSSMMYGNLVRMRRVLVFPLACVPAGDTSLFSGWVFLSDPVRTRLGLGLFPLCRHLL